MWSDSDDVYSDTDDSSIGGDDHYLLNYFKIDGDNDNDKKYMLKEHTDQENLIQLALFLKEESKFPKKIRSRMNSLVKTFLGQASDLVNSWLVHKLASNKVHTEEELTTVVSVFPDSLLNRKTEHLDNHGNGVLRRQYPIVAACGKHRRVRRGNNST